MSAAAVNLDGSMANMYTLRHQKVHWEVDLERRRLLGKTELHIEVDANVVRGLAQFRLNCRQCKIIRVKVDGHKAGFKTESDCLDVVSDGLRDASEFREFYSQWQDQADNGELLIIPKTPIMPGGIVRVGIRFELQDPLGGVHFVEPKDGFFTDRPRHVFTTAAICESRLFMPCVDTFAELSEDGDVGSERLRPQYPTWDLAFTVAKGLTAVSVGNLDRQLALEDGRTIFHYHLSHPTGAHGIGFAIGPFEVYPDPKIRATTHFCMPGLLHNLKHTVDVFPVAATYFEGLLDKGVPYTSYQQVFVDEAPVELQSYAGLSIFNSSLLTTVREIDNTFSSTRHIAGRAVVMQHFYNAVGPKACSDVWIFFGIVGYLSGLFIAYTLGTNEYYHWVRSEIEWLIPRDVHRLPLHTSRHTHVQEYCSEFVQRKSGVIMRMLERLVGKENLLDVFLKLMEGDLAPQVADGEAEPNDGEDDDKAILVSSSEFRQMITERGSATAKQIGSFYSNWVDRPGAAVMRVTFEYKGKENEIDLTLLQHQDRHYLGQIMIGIQDVDSYWEKRIMLQDYDDVIAISLPTRNKKKSRKSVKLSNDFIEQNVDLSDESLPDHPVMWITVDPQMEWYASIEVEMTPKMWCFQAKFERRAHCQVLAIRQLASIHDADVFKLLALIARADEKRDQSQTLGTKDGFQAFWRVRAAAYDALSRHTDRSGTHARSTFLIKHFKGLFCLPKYDVPIVRVNDFTDFQKYFLQRAVVSAVSQLRSEDGTSAEAVHDFIRNLILMNDNSDNPFEDSHYVGSLLFDFARSVDLSLSTTKLQGAAKADHRRRVLEVLDSLARAIGMDKLSPSYHFVVTQKSLEALSNLVQSGTIPRQGVLFCEHALYGHHDVVRSVAVSGIAQNLARVLSEQDDEARRQDIEFLLELAENDPSPNMRFEVLKALAEAAPFADHAINSSSLLTWVVERIWVVMNVGSSFDARCRLRALEFFETILPPEAHAAKAESTMVKVKDPGGQMRLKLTVNTGPTYWTYIAADDETPGHIAEVLECPISELIELNQVNFGKGFTKSAKLLEGTTVLVPHSAKRNPWEIKGQPGYGLEGQGVPAT